jgi:uncharacterized membrane protein YraQ (UPF0718 family)/zinc transporter ZupT
MGAASSPTGVLAIALVLSGLGLLGGPLILSLGRGRATTGALVEGLTLGLVPTMVILRLLPHVMEGLGPLALALALLAFLLLRRFDDAHHRAAARVGRAFIYSALALHSFTDGVSLAAALAASPTRGTMDLTLTLAFVIHRLPEGLFIATTLLPSYGWRRTILRTLGLFAATVAGGVIGGWLLPHLPEQLFDAVVAIGLGAMLQLVVHSHSDRAATPMTRALGGLAMLSGVAIAIEVPTPHDLLRAAQLEELSVVRSLGPLFVETAPAMLLGVVLTALTQAAAHLRTPRRALDALFFGLGLPVGPSGTIPVARGLLAQGTPARVVNTFTLAAPAVTITAVPIALRLLGAPLTLLQLAGATVVALAAGALGGRPRGTPGDRPAYAHVHAPRSSPLAQAPALLLRAIDQLGAWYVAGLLLASVLEAALPQQLFARLDPVALVGAALVALTVHLPLVGLIPVVLVLVHKGIPLDAALVLLLLGPISSRAVFRLLGVRTLGLAAALGIVLSIVAARGVGRLPEIHLLVAHHHHFMEWLGAGAFGLLLVWSFLRLGPRLWFAQLGLGGEVLAADHAHDSHDGDNAHAH